MRLSIVIPVFREAKRAIDLVASLQALQPPPGAAVDVVVVDDGSMDGTADRIEAGIGEPARLVRLETNLGRGRAINRGVEICNGELILFLDADCLPGTKDLLSSHLGAFGEGVIASAGPITGNGAGFWHRYQQEVSIRRGRRHAAGMSYSATSTNFMVSRAAFEAVGGFNESYNNYGFEDRDLQLRLLERGHIAWTPSAVVRHMDTLTLKNISRKMRQAGEFSSSRFAADHPEAYRALGYSTIDPRTHPWLDWPARLAWVAAPALATLGDHFMDLDLLPYGVRRTYARGVTALSYLGGAFRASRSA